MGARHRRIYGDAYYELVDEFMAAARKRYGSTGGWVDTCINSPTDNREERSGRVG